MKDNPLVSCLCVTRHRVPWLRRAVACFMAQTHAHRELVLLYESDDDATRDYAATLAPEATVRCIEVPAVPKRPLGALRNMAIAAARGDVIAQWDDDDWHSPARIEAQLAAMREHGRPACVLYRWTLYDAVARQSYVSLQRAWEGSIVSQRDAIPAYPEWVRGEDVPVIKAMLDAQQLVLLDAPELYVYIHHGTNTWHSAHFTDEMFPASQVLPAEATRHIEEIIGADRIALKP
ncbi:MAG: putative glycosyl transferase, family 2 [Variovorax sp.]|nr:putative glycosyl transferase, family 2 [Variovorax sp.]